MSKSPGMKTGNIFYSFSTEANKKNLPRRIGGEICGWVSKYREINFPTQY